jgi:hypothetical protein
MRSRFVVASSGLDQFDHHVHREPVCTQDRLGVTVTARGKQFEGAAAVRIGTAIVASGRHQCTVTIIAPTRRAWERDGPGLSHVVLRPTRDLPPRKGGGWDRVNRFPRKPPHFNTPQSRQLRYVSRVSAKELSSTSPAPRTTTNGKACGEPRMSGSTEYPPARTEVHEKCQ